MTSSPRWLITFTAILHDVGLGKALDVSLCKVDQISLLISALIPYFVLYFYNQRQNDFYSFIFLTLFIIPVLDMTRLFFIRLIARKSPFSKDLNHFHHILLKRYSLNFSIFIYLSLSFLPFFMIKFFFINPIILVLIQIITFFYFTDKFKPKKT